MGDGYLVKEARCNLLSAIQLRKNYDRIESSGTDFIYQHRVLGSSITFRLEADGYFHTRLVSPEGWGVSAVDFYNPPPLVPVPAAKSAKTWAAIHDVERLHWATNHAGANAMKELCREATYLGSITSSAIDLFYRHRGCSACSIGRMRHHAQLPSTRGLSGIVGHTVQGDFFFIENGEIVLSKTPRRMVTSIGHPKAEWGIVVSRSFNGSGVYEVHLLDGGDRPTRVHRFKFVRNVAIPEHIMDLARKLDAAVLIAPPPPVPEPALPLAAGDDEVDPVEDPMEADEGEDPIEPEMETVAMAQISYSRGLKQSPARATSYARGDPRVLGPWVVPARPLF